MRTHLTRGSLVVAILTFAISGCGGSEDASHDDDFGVGIRLSSEARAGDVGLPDYPGARPAKEGDDSSAAKFGLDLPVVGIHVVAIELETDDTPQRVEAFYRLALARYGNVLECRDGRAKNNEQSELTCDEEDRDKHSVVYKVGSEENQRIVAIKPHHAGTRFSLVHVDVREKRQE